MKLSFQSATMAVSLHYAKRHAPDMTLFDSIFLLAICDKYAPIVYSFQATHYISRES